MVILGEEEVKQGVVKMKDMNNRTEEVRLSWPPWIVSCHVMSSVVAFIFCNCPMQLYLFVATETWRFKIALLIVLLQLSFHYFDLRCRC